ncbi:MAG TPA: MoaD/ThiS family protein [Ktedonosporobacter sp.]|jgi:molybdopterin synthase sulfur carrier subunit|nr:MoaD/ThiS family protein [Ktedonosporobacter sp.]
MQPVTVSLPNPLRAKVGNQASVTVTGQTVREIIDALEENFPGLRFSLCYETGDLRPFVNIFVERENIRYLQGLDTAVPPGAKIHILPSVAGG